MATRDKSKGNLELFIPPDGQLRLLDKSAEQTVQEARPVECLGLTFENDEARRAYFLDELRKKLQDPAFRQIAGFPLGSDEDILRLSDPPYYTACPNPWLGDFVRQFGKPYDPLTDVYHREPLAVDVSEGKTDPIYTAHSYHTKVPHKAIMRAILHYTEPGDLVLDGFAGSGMTGVAAQLCANPDPEFRQQVELERQAAGLPAPEWGARRAILNDLGPAATFIAANYNLPFDVPAFEREARRILAELDAELGWMYETLHTDGKTKGRINFTVWSQVFACPSCGAEVVFLREALDPQTKRVHEVFPCPGCKAELTKDNLQRLLETDIDPATGTPWRRIRFTPALIEYTVGSRRYEKDPDETDLAILARIASLPFPLAIPTTEFPIAEMYHGSRLAPKGFVRIHQLYLPRAVQALATLWGKVQAVEDQKLRHGLLFLVEQAIWGMSILNRYQPLQHGEPGGSQVNRQLSGVYYVASQHAEVNPWYILNGKLNRLGIAFEDFRFYTNDAIVSTTTAAVLNSPDTSIDYIFTDPPFGANLFYADLNFLVESWHRVWTNAGPEAIVDPAKGKSVADYQRLMQLCFSEYYRVLKPGRWATVVFHNSSNAVWNALQEAMLAAGFVVADVRTMDKQQGSYRQVTSTAMKQDLVVSAYKPSHELEHRFQLGEGSEETAWEFTRNHLRQLPRFALRTDGRLEPIAERLPQLLFDRMVAFHVQRGVAVPLSAAEFYAGLERRFPKRDGMFFLADQVAEYDAKRLAASEVAQLELIVTNESSAIQWLRTQLQDHPQTYQDLFPAFLKEIGGWDRYEKRLELKEILDQSFLSYDGKGPIPQVLWTWLGSQAAFRDLVRQSSPDEPSPLLRAEARDRWYVPDPNQAQDLEKVRDKDLLKEFQSYLAFPGRKLKTFRLEAVRAGFKKAWTEKDYSTILEVAAKIPEDVLQEDQKLTMWRDAAETRLGKAT